MKCPIPHNEAYRLTTLCDYRILDTDKDLRFDNLVQIASTHFGVPIALVSLLDADRQWFKAAVGLAVRQTPRHDSFCAYAIIKPDQVFVVEDATLDPRFADNPLVTGEPHIRFYAGAPVVAANGQALGTVCVIDRAPRAFSAADRAMLMRFADIARSILEFHRHTELLRETAKRDPLTGLLNRRGLENPLDDGVAGALGGEGCALLYLDLDHFKQINDRHGHAFGDSLLEEIASRLRGAVRQGDVVARLGGDEFAILLAHPVDEAALTLIAQRVLSACAVPMTVHGETIVASMTAGGAMAPRDALTPGDLLRKADRALYAAKRAGRGRIAVAGYDATIGDDAPHRPAAELLRAIEHDQLTLEWQPCLDLGTGRIRGYEALVRWNHPELGRLAPDRFVPLAEACGMSPQLDSWVLLRACEEAAQCPFDRYFAVNISARWISTDTIVPMVQAALAHSGLSPRRLVLEITESAAIADEAKAITAMQQLKALGIRMALDDFGTGYSSLACLQTYPFDILKLDRTFIAAMGIGARGRNLAAGVMHLAGMLDIAVIAEGVETQLQADLLRAAGCRLGQGYLWATPAPMPWLDEAMPAAKALAAPRSRTRLAVAPQ
jgi:diguanylate cyclase (GGDEF)-like protein